MKNTFIRGCEDQRYCDIFRNGYAKKCCIQVPKKENPVFDLLRIGILGVIIYKGTRPEPAPTPTPGPGPEPEPPGAPVIDDLVPEANAIEIFWLAVPDATSYNVERSLDGFNFTFVTNVLAPLLSYFDTGLTSNTTYYYRVNAENAAGTGPYSPIDSATTLTPPPGPPVTWVQKTVPGSINWREVISDNAGNWVATAVGINFFTSTPQNKLLSSDDGETWSIVTPLPNSLAPAMVSEAITFIPGINRFVICSGDNLTLRNRAWYSDDNGSNWNLALLTISGDSTSSTWTSVCFGNGTLVAVRSRNTAGTTTDNQLVISVNNAVNWTNAYSGGTQPSFNLQCACYGEPIVSSVATPRFVTIGYNAATAIRYILYSDPNGTNWTLQTLSSPSPAIDWRAVCFGNGVYVAVGFEISTTNGYVMSSADGVTWTTPAITFSGTPLTWSSVNFGNGYFVAVSNYAAVVSTQQIMYSLDGVNWTLANAPQIKAWNHVAFSSGTNRWIAIDTDLAMVCDV